jgi:tetratricopeptide (TPR) repeat protein
VRILAVVLVLAVATRAHAGGAEELARARELKRSLDFEGALAATERAIAAGDGDRDALLAAYRLAGELAAGLGREPEAITWFQRLLALDDRAVLPDGTSPKIVAPFDRARINLAGRKLAAHAEGATVVVDEDPLGMVAEVVGRALVDRHGNVLWVAPALAAAPADPPRLARPPVYARWELWTLLTLGFAGSAAWGGKELDDAQDEWDRLRAEDGQHDFSELERVERRGRAWATTTNLMLGAAAVSGTIAVVCMWRQWRRAPVDDTVTVTGAVSHGGAMLGIAGRF